MTRLSFHFCYQEVYFQFNRLHYFSTSPFDYSYYRQEVLFLDNEIAFNEAIIEEREQGIQEIQQQIGEVNEIFKDLAVLVHEQGTMIGNLFLLSFLYLLIALFIYFVFMLSDVTDYILQMILVPTLRIRMLQQHKQKLNLQKLQKHKDQTHLW